MKKKRFRSLPYKFLDKFPSIDLESPTRNAKNVMPCEDSSLMDDECHCRFSWKVDRVG